MSDFPERSIRVGVPQTPRWILPQPRVDSPIVGYGLAVVCTAIAAGIALALQYYEFREVELPVLCLAVAIATWYGGIRPSIVALLLTTASFDYFFTEPIYTFEISKRDLPYFFIFLAWAVLVAWFSAVSRQREDEIRRLNQKLAKQTEELEASNKDLESFAYSVSHDLRAPLRHLAGFSELLQRQASSLLDDKSLRYIQTIVDSAKRMGNLIDDLLAFSRVGRTETKKVWVNLEQLVREVVAELSQGTRDRQIDWTIDALPVCYGDRSMLKLVIVNLLSNAVKFTRMRSPARIEIGSVLRNNEPEMFVRDNGVGFDMQYANKLFGVFQRLHRAEQFEGTGIGLATVQRIIQRHGGKVRGEGEVDQGATFYFSLPNAIDAAERTANTQ